MIDMPDARAQQTPNADDRLGRALAVSNSRPPIAMSRGGGGLVIKDAAQALQVAEAMSKSGYAVRPFMRNNVGTCLAVVVQALEWEFSPFAVAQKAYMVNDQLAYESQLVQAVIIKRAPIKGRIRFRYDGEEQDRRCWAKAFLDESEAMEPGDFVEVETPRLKNIKPQNSPLWKTDPDQQFSYYAGRLLCRRYFPEVLLGVVTEDEVDRDAPPLHTGAAGPALTGQAEGPRAASPASIADRLDRIAGAPPADGRTIDHREDEREAEEQRDRAESFDRLNAGEHARGAPDPRPGEAPAPEASRDEPNDADDADGPEVDRVPDGAGRAMPPQDDDTFPGDRPTARESRREEILAALRRAAPEGRRALDAVAGDYSDDDFALVPQDDRKSLIAIADEVDQRSKRRGRG